MEYKTFSEYFRCGWLNHLYVIKIRQIIGFYFIKQHSDLSSLYVSKNVSDQTIHIYFCIFELFLFFVTIDSMLASRADHSHLSTSLIKNQKQNKKQPRPYFIIIISHYNMLLDDKKVFIILLS